MGTQDCKTYSHTAAKGFEREKSQLCREGGVETKVRARPQVGGRSLLGLEWEGRERRKGGKLGSREACYRKAEMQVRTSATPVQVAGSKVPSQAGKGRAHRTPSLPGLYWTAEQTLTGMSGGHRVYQSHKHKQKLQANSLTQNIWLETARQRNLEAWWGFPPTSVITCPVSWAEYFCRT